MLLIFLLAYFSAAAAVDTATIQLSSTPLSPPISPVFASFSLEISSALQYLGTAGSLNLPFINLCNVLRNVSSGRGPSIRIGGNSADSSVYWDSASPLPANQTYAITSADILAYAAAFPMFDGYAVIDTSMFLQDSVAWPVAHISAVRDLWGFERVEGIEIGNEVEIYHDSGMRPRNWTFASYQREFTQHTAALRQQAGMPNGLIQGAVFCCNNSDYNAAFANYTRTFAAQGLLASVSYHHYSIGGCGGKPPPPMTDLLADQAAAGAAAFLLPFVTAAREAGVAFRVGEGNSVSCGGKPNISDVFGAALYSLDVMAHLAAIGAQQWNWHGGPGASYAPISFARHGAPGPPDVRPLFYGMWAFATATAKGSAILAAAVSSSNPLIKLWGLAGPGGAFRVLAIHKDFQAATGATVSVRLPPGLAAGSGGGRLARLLAPSVFSHYNVTFAGQTFDGSADGLPLGAPQWEHVPLQADGSLLFELPLASAAILTFTAQ